MWGACLPLSDYEGQVKVVEKRIALWEPTKGAMVLGCHVGNMETPRETVGAKRMRRHYEAGFAETWQEVWGQKRGVSGGLLL
jgi:hypothetical protein